MSCSGCFAASTARRQMESARTEGSPDALILGAWARSGGAAASKATMAGRRMVISMPPAPRSHQFPHALHEPVDLVRRRIACGTRAHEPVRAAAEPLGDGG